MNVYWCFHSKDKAVGSHVLARNAEMARRSYSAETATDFFLVKAEQSRIYSHKDSQDEVTEPLAEPLIMFSAGANREGGTNNKEFTAVSKKKNLFFVAVNADKDIGDNTVVFYLYNSISESCLQIVTELYTPCRKTIECCRELVWQFSLVPSRVNGEWELTAGIDYRGKKDRITVILSE